MTDVERFKVDVMMQYAIGGEVAQSRGLPQTADYLKRRFMMMADAIRNESIVPIPQVYGAPD